MLNFSFLSVIYICICSVLQPYLQVCQKKLMQTKIRFLGQGIHKNIYLKFCHNKSSPTYEKQYLIYFLIHAFYISLLHFIFPPLMVFSLHLTLSVCPNSAVKMKWISCNICNGQWVVSLYCLRWLKILRQFHGK